MTSTPPATLAADAVDVAGRLLPDDGVPTDPPPAAAGHQGRAPTLSAALATIVRDGPLTLGELAAREHVAPPSITKAVEKPWAAGLVTVLPTRPTGGWVRVRHRGRSPAGGAEPSGRTVWLAAGSTHSAPPTWPSSTPPPTCSKRLIDQSDGRPRMKAKTLEPSDHVPVPRNRNFRFFFGGQPISQAGTWLTTIASPCWCSS